MPAKYELSVEILFNKKHSTHYLLLDNYYFYPKSFTWGNLNVVFADISENDAAKVIENMKLLKVEDETHIRYKSKQRLRAEKIEKAMAEYNQKKKLLVAS